MDSYLLLGSCF
ncbi:hypothetical protein E2C01_099579 [Portunus trituberculatus]|uniref:Uncharacterized protein n=1 Tax=Portunus trituberculatus TaxID=210409 RepID=A0A5B7KA11_PORTR|nr:hypothetical protein [Portunus trituberculatus]